MALVSQSTPGMYGGVSQQSPAIRHPTQCDVMENAYPTVVRGLSKRPPSQHLMQALPTALASTGMVHFINRSSTEKYAVIFQADQTIRVFDLINAVEKTVTMATGASAYLSTDPATYIRAITVADYTFVVNTNKTVTMQATPVAPGTLDAAFQSLAAINDTSTYGHGIYPPTGYHEITGDGQTDLDSFFVFGDGEVWREVAKPGVATTIDRNTMPHTLVRNADGTFTFGPIDWGIRVCGDTVTSPNPSFVGKKINDVFFHRNRLGFISGENIILSEAGEFFNFFRTTAMDILDSDPIDTAVSHNRASTLNHAVPFRKSLYLFAAQAQFVMSSDSILSPRTAAADQTTEYDAHANVRPVGSGASLFFSTPGGTYSHLYEYYVEEDTAANVAANVSAHVPQYIPASVKEIAVSTNYDVAFLRSTNDADALYVYKFYWQGNEKAQSAWCKWDFGDDATIRGIGCIDNYLYMAVSRSSGTSIERVDLEVFATTDSLGFLIHLDRLSTVTSKVYDPINDWTTFSLPYGVADGIDVRFVLGDGFTGQLGVLIPTTSYTRVNSYTYRVPGNYTAGTVYCGEPYTMTFRFSPLFYTNSQGKVLDGDLRVRNMTVYYQDSSYFQTRVTPYGRQPQTQVVIPGLLNDWNDYGFTGKTVGAAALVLGAPTFMSGKFRFPVMSNAKTVVIELLNDSHLACHFTKAEWEGNYVLRSRRT